MTIAGKKIILNSRGLIPAVIQMKADTCSEVVNLVYLNQEAFEMTVSSGELYLYRRSKRMVEKFAVNSRDDFKIQTIFISKNQRSLLVTIALDEETLPDTLFIHKIFPLKFEFEEN